MDATTAASPQPRTFRAGWGWLLLCTVARFYLALMGAMAACAVLPMLFDLSGAVVQSGSMQPHIGVGDVVLSRALSPDAPTPLGRVVTFKAPPGSPFHGDVLHRLVAINSDGSLATKGDANARPDSAPLARRDIISTACLLIPWVGLPFLWVTTGAFGPLATWVLLTMAALLIAALDATGQPPQLRAPPEDPGPTSGPDPDTQDLAEPSTPTLVRPPGNLGESIPSVVGRFRPPPGRHPGIAAAVVSIAALVLAPFGSASAAFSATTGAVGNSFATSGPSTQLAFISNPSSSTGGVPFSAQPVVAVQDAGGDTVGVSSVQVTLHIATPAGAILTCTTNPAKAAAGIATFTGCRIDKVGTYTLTATSGSLTSAVSATFTISAGVADKLAFTTSPSDSSSGVAFPTQPVVTVQDSGGNTVTSSTASVTLSITPPPGGAILTCAANPITATSGVATFSACTISAPGTYTLTAVSGGLSSAASASATIVASTATKLAFTTNPSNSTGGTTFATQPVVTVQDANGNTATGSQASVDLSITTPAGATLTCTEDPKNAVSGIVTFAGCRVDRVGNYTLTATSSGLTSAISASFTITVGPATKLGFTRVPANTAVNTAFAAQPQVAIQDAGGNTRTASSASITLTITPPTGAALTNCSANPASSTSGVATFAGCRINSAGTYTLTATASGLTTAVSTTITIYGPASALTFTTAPSDGTGGTAFPVQPVVTVQDAGGRTVANSIASVTLSITTPAGATLTCTTNPKAAVAGVDSFAACKVNKPGTYTLTAASGGLTSAISASFTITVGPATKLAFTTSPTSSTGGTAFATQPVVTVQDAGGNTVTTSSAPVTLSITTPAGATLTCTTNPKTAASGVATFAGCKINKTGTYTLTAASGSLTAVNSTSFTITVGPATQLAFTTSPSGSTANIAFAAQPQVTIQDAGGNTVTTSGPSVTLTITPPAGGAVLTCAQNPRTTSAGAAIFSACRINQAGTYTLTATSGSLTAATSNNLTIT